MLANILDFVKPNQTIAVALSGGGDSMALLHYMLSVKDLYAFNVIAINVEHGIRGESSIKDTEFVKSYCNKVGVELLCYSVDCLAEAKKEKLSVEQAARKLRYQCFFDAIDSGKCDKVATAHHRSDLAESVLFNILRGTGVKGAIGIKENYSDKIIRPFLSVGKDDVEKYLKTNSIPFVTDETNLTDDYTRNSIRHNVMPEIKKLFPESEKSILRFAEIARSEDDFMEQTASDTLTFFDGYIELKLPQHNAILSRAAIIAMRHLGVEKDWEKAHIDAVIKLSKLNNGAKINLKNGVVVAKEYDKLTFYKQEKIVQEQLTFELGNFEINGVSVTLKSVEKPQNLKDGFYADLSKIPQNSVIRFKKDGDIFTKFGGGTKPLGEYLTDLKIPLRKRDFIPVIANGNTILAIVGVAISEKIKVDESTTDIIQIL